MGSWWDRRLFLIARHVVRRYFQDEIGRLAAALTYYLLFSFFPLLLFVSGILSYSHFSPSLLREELGSLLPNPVLELFASYLQHVSELPSLELLVLSIPFTCYFPVRAVHFLMRAVRKAYRMGGKESPLRHYSKVVLFTLVLMGSLIVTLFLLTLGRPVMDYFAQLLSIPSAFLVLWRSLRFLGLGLLLFLVLCLLYRLSAPSKVPLRYTMPGALGALIAWMSISIGFSYYVENLAHYSVLYGSIGAIVILLLWLYFSATTLLLGAELNQIILQLRRGDYFL